MCSARLCSALLLLPKISVLTSLNIGSRYIIPLLLHTSIDRINHGDVCTGDSVYRGVYNDSTQQLLYPYVSSRCSLVLSSAELYQAVSQFVSKHPSSICLLCYRASLGFPTIN